jgi:hypothetical protein
MVQYKGIGYIRYNYFFMITLFYGQNSFIYKNSKTEFYFSIVKSLSQKKS